jgi:CheY-like chemotaxis protein
MLPGEEFVDQLTEAYEHLYDVVYLRTHPLANSLGGDSSVSPKQRAWKLHRTLLDLIEDLDPGASAPPFSRAWRRHRLMVLRYTDGLDPQTVADRLAISRRTYYRELRDAITAAASLLADRLGRSDAAVTQDDGKKPEQLSPERLELLRLEAARLTRAKRYTQVTEVIEGSLQLMQELARQRGVQVITELPGAPAVVAVDHNTVRQVLLGTLSYLIQHLDSGSVHIRGEPEDEAMVLMLEAQGDMSAPEAEDEVRFSVLNELARLQRVELKRIMSEGVVTGFELALPSVPPRTGLVADDNEDAIQLFKRYLAQHTYAVITARTGAEAIAQARASQPFAITLDLMMPDQDGWDVLQTLTNQPRTQHIPVIVCTVLSVKELALSLGATLFLEKPVSEQALISALASLERG